MMDRPMDSKYGERIGSTTPLAIMKKVRSERKGRNFRDPKMLRILLTGNLRLGRDGESVDVKR